MFPRTFLVALLVAAASAARNMPAGNAAAAAGAAPQAAVAANAPDPAVYARAVEVSDADRAAAAPIISFLKKIPTPPAQVLAAASKALSLSNPSTGSTISAPDAAASAFGSVTSFAQKTVESAGQAAPMPDSFKAAAAQSGAWAAVEQTRANAAAAAQKSANAAAKDAAAAP